MNLRRAEIAIAWIAAVPFAVWAVIRLFGLDSGYPLEAMMPFTPYIAALSVAAVALALALRCKSAAALAAVAAICLGAAVLPRQFETETVSAEGHETLKVLAANVRLGSASPTGFMRLVDELHPEVVTIEEYTPRFGHELQAIGIERRLPYHVLDAEPRAKGTAIFSTFPLRRLPTEPFFFKMARAETTLRGGQRLRIVAVHPDPPRHHAVTGEWGEVLSRLPSTGHGVPWLLSGDFNATFDMSPFRELVGRGYRDAGKAAGKAAGKGLDGTFPATANFPPPITIDHILADERFGVVEYEVEPLPNSDHHAIYAELTVP